jgi:threonylcarbamoyladenosine tRNA methylthiotransferase MtaB
MTPHLHLCLQSGSDRVLRRMRRMYTLDRYMAMINDIRGRIPDFNFTTDIIVGFPGETEEDFNQTQSVVRNVGFTHVHTFKYSVREGTRAARLDAQVSDETKAERSREIRAISEANKRKYYGEMLGKPQRVLVERNPDGEAYGLGEHYIPIKIFDSSLKENDFAHVILEGVEDDPKLLCLGRRCS